MSRPALGYSAESKSQLSALRSTVRCTAAYLGTVPRYSTQEGERPIGNLTVVYLQSACPRVLTFTSTKVGLDPIRSAMEESMYSGALGTVCI